MVHRYTDWKINSFAEAEERYNTTKPVISKNHTKEQDIRPYGARSRKWERIEKVNANCYIIWNGDDGDPCQQFYWNWSGSLNPTPKQQMELAPIVWKRKGNMESIRIRNGSGNYAHCSRYTFLENTLPNTMGFLVLDGKQYVALLNGETYAWNANLKYLLPKSMYVPFGNRRRGHGLVETDDKKYLTFERKIGEPNTTPWQVVGATWEYIGAKTKVDKKAKADIKPHTDKFYEWIVTMYRMLPITDWDYRQKMRDELQDWVYNHKTIQPYQAYMEIMRDEEHPMRLHLAVDWMSNSNLTTYDWQTSDHTFTEVNSNVAKQVRANWNRYINKKLGLISKASPEKIERK